MSGPRCWHDDAARAGRNARRSRAAADRRIQGRHDGGYDGRGHVRKTGLRTLSERETGRVPEGLRGGRRTEVSTDGFPRDGTSRGPACGAGRQPRSRAVSVGRSGRRMMGVQALRRVRIPGRDRSGRRPRWPAGWSASSHGPLCGHSSSCSRPDNPCICSGARMQSKPNHELQRWTKPERSQRKRARRRAPPRSARAVAARMDIHEPRVRSARVSSFGCKSIRGGMLARPECYLGSSSGRSQCLEAVT
jgi:hypothetical protein